jgi:hypothetical protein
MPSSASHRSPTGAPSAAPCPPPTELFFHLRLLVQLLRQSPPHRSTAALDMSRLRRPDDWQGQRSGGLPYCHGWEVRDEPFGILATGPASVHHAWLFRAGWGAAKRCSPTGGWAKGMPRKTTRPSSLRPRTVPPLTWTSGRLVVLMEGPSGGRGSVVLLECDDPLPSTMCGNDRVLLRSLQVTALAALEQARLPSGRGKGPGLEVGGTNRACASTAEAGREDRRGGLAHRCADPDRGDLHR